jgi:hypothetical protein
VHFDLRLLLELSLLSEVARGGRYDGSAGHSDRDSLEPGALVMLFPTRVFGSGADVQLGRQYDVTVDGLRRRVPLGK